MKFAKIAALAAVAAVLGFAGVSAEAAVSASAIYSPSTGYLKTGSGMGAKAYQAANVMAAQTALNACVPGSALVVDGKMGPLTTAKFKAFQALKGIAQDGIIGPITAAQLAACSGDTNTGSTGGSSNNGGSLSGGAGDLTVNQTSSGVESDVKEDGEENVLGLKLEAEDSDIKVTNIKVSLQNNSGNGSTRLDKYVDEVKVYLEDEEVGSADADDFSKDGSIYSKSIALNNAIVEDGDTVNLYVAVVTQGTVDDDTADFDVAVTDLRFQDATGAIMSESYDDDANNDGNINDADVVENFGFDPATADDKLSVKSNSDNPAASTLKVDDSNDSDEYLVFAARLEADDDGSDITLNEVTVKVKMDDPDQATTSSTVDDIIKTLMISIDGEEFDLDLDTNEDADGVNYAKYVADIDGDITIDAGDTVDVEVYAVFNETNNQGVYANGTTLDIQFASADIDADGADELTVANNNLSGTQNSKTHTLNESTADVKNFNWTKTEPQYLGAAGTIDFFFTVEADDDDFDVLTSSIDDTSTGTGTFVTPGSGEVTNADGAFTRVSGDSVTSISGGYRVAAGDTVTFRVRYTATASGDTYEATVESVAGVEVDDTKQISPSINL